MSRDGSGGYNRVASTPYVNGSTISSTVVNNEMTDLGNEIANSIAKDGQTTVTANLPMATHRHTGVGNSAARTDYASAADVQDGTLVYLTTVAGTNTITATAANSMTAYAAGQKFHFIPANTNTGATTININSIGAKNIYSGGAALVGGEIVANSPVELVYDGTQFNLISVSFLTGSWTPALGGTATYNSNSGRYIKIGSKVLIEGHINVNAIGTGSTYVISGLPFTSNASAPLGVVSVGQFIGISSSVVSINGVIPAGNTVIDLYSLTAAGASSSTNNIFKNSAVVYFAGQYST